jgi:4-amino-4-deoxy-L-arabinose transferase-like glycosyltransferase
MKKAVIKQIGLVLLVAFSLFLRLYKISSLPPSLNWDEVSHGFNAFSVLETGKDEWGQSFPLIFRAYGDYKLPLYIYLTSLSIKFFGLNIFSVRLVSALAGTGLVLVSYLIALKITKSKSLSFFAAFLTAVSPWSLFVSRAGLEANLAAFLFALGVYFLINFLDKSDYKKLSYTAFFWGLSVYAYNSARVLVPLFVLFCLLLFIKTKVSFRHIKLGLIVLSIFSLPVIGQIFNKTGQARFNLVAINDEGAVAKIIEQRQNSKLGPFVTRLIYTRQVNFLHTAFKNYISNLSPRYLFLRGGSHYQFSMPDHELLYLVISPFLLFGLGRCLFSKEAKVKLLFFWFLAAFIPSAITKDAPHVLRSILILPAPMIISAYGVGGITERIKGRSLFKGQLLLWVLIFAVLVSFARCPLVAGLF